MGKKSNRNSIENSHQQQHIKELVILMIITMREMGKQQQENLIGRDYIASGRFASV